jgi:hypothetical protein
MAWSLEGNFFENCSCDAICPCTWSNGAHRATHDYCRFALAFEIDNGDIEGIDVGGVSFLMIAETPPQMLEGNWRVGVLVDESATEEQMGALGRVLTGEMGGPFEALSALIGEFMGMERQPIDITTDGTRHHVRAGDVVDYEGVRTTLETGEPVQLTNIVIHPAGPTLALAPVTRAANSPFGLEWSGEDLSGFANRFAWAA